MLMLGQKAQRNWSILATRKLNALSTGFNHYCRRLDVMFLPFPKNKDYASLWETLLIKTPYKDDFENVLHLVEILLVQPISAAQCERAISAQNRIKSSVRVNLAVSTLEDLIRISAEGPPAAEFDPTPSVNKWLARNRDAGERLRRPHFQRSSLK
ncbi:unnamed protein product [Pocillopora meandrina]|uniref:HAT C-terminal dimerisation domain-containing protein n=1 Tax=Pocillopora meandrina TaxID=46732 RepID=A0AAU9WGZ0_9CNID|nr:unnamed protein product [Pocillopora meandrina]